MPRSLRSRAAWLRDTLGFSRTMAEAEDLPRIHSQ
jgi:hypothetical protein